MTERKPSNGSDHAAEVDRAPRASEAAAGDPRAAGEVDGWSASAMRRQLQSILGTSAEPSRWHRPYAPQLAYGRHLGPASPFARDAAVLVLLARGPGGDWRITLTRRPATMSTHADQVSFPGGVREAGESLRECAEREWHEELGRPGVSWQAAGQLTPLYVYASDFLVTPCVYVAESAPRYTPNPAEVAAVIELPLDELLRYAPPRSGRVPIEPESLVIQRADLQFHAPSLRIGEHVVWGATLMMLGELRERWLARHSPAPRHSPESERLRR